ncbi:MAG: hypothetical protein E7607_05255 [Ruminococcaceae bacterium]|nr:hypothetical protein [Oscillospiraceae bacterium]
MLKKIIACLLILSLAVCAVSCGKKNDESSDAPEGMKSATVDGEPFELFVPMSWLGNTLSGISSATYPYTQGISVSARYISTADDLDTYLRKFHDDLEGQKGYMPIEKNADTLLGNEPAKRSTYSYVKGEESLRITYISVKRGDDIISLSFFCPASEYDNRTEDFEKIRTNFRFKEKTFADGEVIIDEDTPAGMKLASNPEIEYKFYVPTTWACSPNSGASDAYFPESEKTNVVVTSYIPPNTGRVSVEDYFKDCERQYIANFEEYTLISESPEIRKNPIEDMNMYCYTFTVKAGGETVRIMQAVFAFNQSFYTVTYTARNEAKFNEHLEDFYKILDNFCFI